MKFELRQGKNWQSLNFLSKNSVSKSLVPTHSTGTIAGLFLLAASFSPPGSIWVLAGPKANPNVVRIAPGSARGGIGRAGPALSSKGCRGRRSNVATDTGGNVSTEHRLRLGSLVFSSRIDLDLLVPGTTQQLIFSKQQVSLVLVASSRLGEGKLCSSNTVVASLFAFGKVEFESASLAIDAGTDALHHVGTTMLAK